MACKYLYQDKEYTEESFYDYVKNNLVEGKIVPKYERILFPSGNTSMKIEGHTTLEEFKNEKIERIEYLESRIKYQNENVTDIIERNKNIDNFNNEINQLKQELERVETEGFGALKPIYNFYENTVTNILNKTYGKENVKQVTDEFGNTWNEVVIKNEFKEGISLNLSGKSEKLNALPNNKWFNKVVQPIINRFSKMFPNIKVNVISVNEIPKEVADKVQNLNAQINSFYHKGQVYIIKERVSKDITIEEFLHPFVNALEKDNSELFNSLLREAKELFPELKDKVFADYDKVYTSIFDKNREFLTQALTQKVSELLPEQQTWFDKFKTWLKSILDRMFGNDFLKRDISQLDEAMSLTELASILSENNTFFDIKGDETTYYSLSNEEIISYLNKPNLSPLQKQSLTLILENNKVIDFVEDTHEYSTKNVAGEVIQLKPVSSFIYTKKFTDDFSEYANLGNFIHDLVKQVNTDSITIPELIEKFKKSELAELFKSKGYPEIFLDQMFSSIYNYVKALSVNGSLVMSEVSVGSVEDKVAGTIDLIEIKQDGSVVIHDFKSMLLGKNLSTTYGKVQTLSNKFNQNNNQKQYAKQLTLYAKMLKQVLGFDTKIDLQIVPIGYVGEGNVTEGVGRFELPKDFDSSKLYYSPIDDNTLTKFKVPYLVEYGNEILSSTPENKRNNTKNKEQIDREKVLSALTVKLQEANSKQFEAQLENTFRSVVDIYKKYGSSKDELNKKLYELFDKEGVLSKTKIDWEALYKRLSEMTEDDPERVKYHLATLVQYINYIEELSVGIKNIRNNFSLIVNNKDKLSNQELLSLMKKSFDLANSNKNIISQTLNDLKDIDQDNLLISYLKESLADIDAIKTEYYKRSLPLISEVMNKYFPEEDKQGMIKEYQQRIDKFKWDLNNIPNISEKSKENIETQIQKYQLLIDRLPSPNIISEVIQGKFGDSDWFFSNLFANINNPNYVIAGTEKYMQDIMRDLKDIAITTQEEMGRQHADFQQAMGVSKDTPKELNKDLTYEVKSLVIKKDGTTETQLRLALITEVDQNVYYDKQVLEHKVAISTGQEKEKAKQELRDFIEKNEESKYSVEYQKVLDSIDVNVSDGRNVKEVYRQILNVIQDIKIRNNPKDYTEGNLPEEELFALREAWRDYNNLYSDYDRDGNKKTGADLEIANVLRDRRSKLNEFRNRKFNKKAWENSKAKKIAELLSKYNNVEEVIQSEEYRDWQSKNTTITSVPEFYEKRKELLDKINVILLKREYKDVVLVKNLGIVLNSKWDQLTSVVREYRDFEKEVQVNDLPENIKDQLKELEESIIDITNQIKTVREKMSPKDAKDLGDLYEAYNNMVEYKTTKYYQDDLEKAMNEFAVEKDLSVIDIQADEQLMQEFKLNSRWYQNSHVQRSRFDTSLGENVMVTEPAYYYKVIIPTNPDFIKEQPAAQYASYELKESALNPNYLDQFGRPKIKTTSKYVAENLAYLRLKNATDNKGKAKYKAIKYLQNLTEKSQIGLDSHNYLYYFIPSKQKTLSERVLEDKGKGLWTNIKNNVVAIGEDQENLGNKSVLTNMVGEEAKFIPVTHTYGIELKNQSFDIWDSFLQYGLSSEKSKLFEKHLPIMEVLVDQLKTNQPSKGESIIDSIGNSIKNKLKLKNIDTSVKDTSNTMLRNVENIIDRYFYDEWQKELGTVFGMSDVKLTNTLLGAAGANMMMLNIPNWFVNYASGNIQLLIESTGKRYITPKDVSFAKLELTKKRNDLISDISKTHDKSLIGQLTDYYDPMKGEYLNEYGKKLTWSKRTNIKEVLFFGKNLGEWEMQMTSFLAMMKAKKVKQILPNGQENIISLYDAYEKGQDGLPKLKEGVQFTKEQERDYMNKIHAINKALNGSYAKMDQTFVENYSIGRLLFFMKKFFLPLWINRYFNIRGDWELGDVREGHYMAFYQTVMKDLYRLKGNIPEIVAKMKKSPEEGGYTDLQKQSIKKTLTEVAIIAAMFFALAMLGYDDGEDDSDAKKYAQYFFLKLRREIAVFTPVTAHQEFIGIFSRPIAAASYIGNTANLIETGMKTAIYYPTGMFEDDVLYQKKTALFDKGDSKFLGLLYKFAGIKLNLSEPQQLLQSYQYSIRY